MIARFLSLFVVSVLLAGCAGSPMRYDIGGAHFGRNTVVGHVSGIAGAPMQYGGVPAVVGMPIAGYMGSNPYPAEACPAGYRQINGVYQCMGGGYASPVYGNTMYSNGPMIQSVRVPDKCDFGSGDIRYTFEGQAGCNRIASAMTTQVARTVVTQSDELVSSRKQAYRRSDGVCFFSDNGPATLPPQCREARSLPGANGEYRSQWVARANRQ